MPELESVNALKTKGVGFRLIKLSQRAVSVEEVVRYSISEIAVDEICKTILLKGSDGDTYAVLLLGGDRVNLKKAEGVIGAKVRIASPDEVEAATGVEPGAVCPVLLKGTLLIDGKVMEKDRINFGSGHHLYGLEIDPDDLKRLVDYRVVDVVEARSSSL